MNRSPVRRIVRLIGDLPMVVNIAVRAHSLSTRVMRHHMQYGYDDPRVNGEFWLLRTVAHEIRTYVDVGANRGDYCAAVLAECPSATGFAFDPGIAAYAALTERFSGERRVTVQRVAISDTSGKARFYEEPDVGLGSSLIRSIARSGAIEIATDVTTIDIVAHQAKWDRIDLLKIDAEGHDLPVMRGAGELLMSGAIGLIQFEYHRTWATAGHTLLAALNMLDEYGYATYLIKGEGLYSFNYTKYGDFFSYANFASFPKGSLSRFRSLLRGDV